MVYPDLEVQHNIAHPLVELQEKKRIALPDFEMPRLHDLDTEVFVLAGRWDHTVDYRSSIALAASYPHHHLFIADDDHMFQKLKDNGNFYRLMQDFLGSGLGSPELNATLDAVDLHRWREP